nr:nuclear distribution protein nude like 1 [Quercus suber]
MSEAPTPPSPPLSDTPTHNKADPRTPSQASSRPKPQSATPRPSVYGPRTAAAPRHARGPSNASSKSGATSDAKSMQPPTFRSRPVTRPSITHEPLPRSESLLQIKGLRSRMAKIEERVHSARSKLPAPKDTTPRGSPRNMTRSPRHADNIPSSITVRRTAKRPSSSITSASQQYSTAEESSASEANPSRRESLVKRLSYSSAIPTIPSIPRPASTTGSRHSITSNSILDRPASALDRRPPSRSSLARPPSRSGAEANAVRPPSRTSVRPRTSVGGIGPPPSKSLHRPSASVSELRRLAADDMASSGDNLSPTKSSSGHSRRQSGRISFGYGSQSIHEEGALGEMRPPSRVTNGNATAPGQGRRRQMSDVEIDGRCEVGRTEGAHMLIYKIRGEQRKKIRSRPHGGSGGCAEQRHLDIKEGREKTGSLVLSLRLCCRPTGIVRCDVARPHRLTDVGAGVRAAKNVATVGHGGRTQGATIRAYGAHSRDDEF